nr:hypothetical protein CFP56_25898 [Quercus suber]
MQLWLKPNDARGSIDIRLFVTEPAMIIEGTLLSHACTIPALILEVRRHFSVQAATRAGTAARDTQNVSGGMTVLLRRGADSWDILTGGINTLLAGVSIIQYWSPCLRDVRYVRSYGRTCRARVLKCSRVPPIYVVADTLYHHKYGISRHQSKEEPKSHGFQAICPYLGTTRGSCAKARSSSFLESCQRCASLLLGPPLPPQFLRPNEWM